MTGWMRFEMHDRPVLWSIDLARFRILLAFFFLAVSAFAAKADITTGLVAYLTMDQTNGTSALDSTANGHVGMLKNFPAGTSQWVAGRTNGALNFSSTNDEYATIADSNNQLNFGITSNATFTISFWVKGTGSYTNGTGLLGRGKAAGSEQYVFDLYLNKFRFYCRDSNGVDTINVTDLRPSISPNGNWQHLAVVFDAASGTTNGIKFYINGQLAAQSITNAPRALLKNTDPVTIGTREDQLAGFGTFPFNGALDDLRFYNRALTASDVQQLFNAAGGAVTSNIPSSAFDALRATWGAILNGGTNLNLSDPDVTNALAALSTSVQSYWTSMITATNRLYLWNDLADVDTDSTVLWSNYYRLREMSLAYATAGTVQYHNPNFLNDLTNALDWMYTNRYNETKSEVDNWWHWEIGVPLWLNDISVLLYPNLSGTEITNYMNAINHFSPTPTGTGANLLWKATVVGVSGVIIQDSSKITAASSSLSSLFPYVTASDGFYVDGSFIQHGDLAYTGSYGSSLLIYIAPLLQMLNGSMWQVTDTNVQNVYPWVYNSYQPVIYNGLMMDMVRGRAKSREDETDQSIGQQTIQAILQLAQFAPGTNAAALKSMVKYWIQSDTASSFTANASLGTLPLTASLLADTNVTARGELLGHYTFGSMDRVVHLRPGYGFGISMFSSRIANYESINGENFHDWYAADGMTCLYNSDQIQYDDNFWPTVNPYRLPGTTVDTQTRANSSGAGYRGVYSWVGGAGLNGYGAAGMQLDAWSSTLIANKSWFMFADEIVCLGAGITSSDSRTIESIVENRKLDPAGDNILTVNGVVQPASLGWSTNLTNISWAHLAGSVPGADVGYFFPQAANVDALREARSGSWYDLNTTEFITTNDFTRDYFTLWFDHGLNPTNAGYSYVLLPGMSAQQVGVYATNPPITILQNSSAIQAVSQNTLGLVAANFWNDGSQTIGGVTVNRKASIVMQTVGTNLSLAVADPTHTNTAGIIVTLNRAVGAVVALDAGVTVNQLTPVLQLTVNTSAAAGKSFHASFTLPNQPPVAVNDIAYAEPGMPVLIDVLANDSDPDNGPSPLALQSLTFPIHGGAVISQGMVQYTSIPGYSGGDSFNYTITDGNLTANATVNVSVAFATNFSSFQAAHFTPAELANPAISGATSDPDGDGVNNLMEYALMTNPLKADKTTLQPRMVNGLLTFTYTKRKVAADIQMIVEVSNDLIHWDSSGSQITQSLLSDNGSEQLIQVSEKSTNAGSATRYFRLRVALLP